mmetsp:Transcript_177/g.761  ORF Transcript_177/g.761 Transcript_177/m.761 type:complete len:225 (-) Transcript_177:51-725(-)
MRRVIHHPRGLQLDVPGQSRPLAVPAVHLAAHDEPVPTNSCPHHGAKRVEAIDGLVVHPAGARLLERVPPVSHERVAALALRLAGEGGGGFQDVEHGDAVHELRLRVPRVPGVPRGAEDLGEVAAPGDDVRRRELALVQAGDAQGFEDRDERRGPRDVPVAIEEVGVALGEIEGYRRMDIPLGSRAVVDVRNLPRLTERGELDGFPIRRRARNLPVRQGLLPDR